MTFSVFITTLYVAFVIVCVLTGRHFDRKRQAQAERDSGRVANSNL